MFANTTQSYQFNHYNYEDGLLSNTVNCIIQDQDGFMWFGTSEGLCRFDGYGFKNFKNLPGDDHSLNTNFISSIAEDVYRNCIWVVTSAGVSRLDKTTYKFKNYPISDSSKEIFSPFFRGTVCIDHLHNVWIEGFSQVYSEGLFKYDSDNDSFINLSKQNKNVPKELTVIYEDRNNQLWVGTNHGLYSFNPQLETFRKVSFKNDQVDSLHITCLYQGKDDKLWIGTHHDHAVYVLEDDSITLQYESEYSKNDYNWISSIGMYNDHILMLSIKDLGVQTIDLNDGSKSILQPDMYKPNGINSKNPFTIYPDKLGNIWIGTYNNGVNFLDKHKKKFDLYRFDYTPSGLLSNNVRAFCEDSDGDIWVGTKEGGGISKFDTENGTFENFKADPSRPDWLDNDIVICINEIEKDKLLVGTYGGGIYLFNKKKRQFSKFAMPNGRDNSISNKFVYALFKDKDQRIWIGSNSSVDIHHIETGKFSHPKGVNYARCFLDNGKAILIGTWTKGLYIYEKSEKLIKNYNFKHPALQKDKNIRINSMAQDLNGFVWMATNRGLLRYSYSDDVELLLTEKDGLPINYICAVLIDDHNNLWASTKIGIVKYNQKTKESKLYNKFDGLQSNVFEEFVSLKTKDGFMMFSGLNGFNIFHPDSIKDNTISPKVHLTDMKILNESVKIGTDSPLTKHISLTDKVTLKNEQSSFEFEFVAVNYTSQKKAKYLFMLEGYDTDWQEAGETRIANYTMVPPGTYSFKVKASNGDGVWSDEAAAIEVKVKPPFARSLPAFIMYFLMLVAFMVGYRIIIRNRTMQKNRLDEEIQENKRLEDLSRKRVKFFTNISHELRTPLTLIASPLERLTNYNTSDKQLSSLFHIMNRNAQRLLRIVNQLMDFRRIEENRIQLRVAESDIVKYVEELLSNFNDIANNRSIKLNFHTNYPDGFVGWFDAGILDKITFNLLSNAVKFSPVNGEIDVEVVIDDNKEVNLRVIDKGIGIPAEDIDKIFERFYTTDHADHQFTGAGVGLSFTKSLIDLHKGTKKVTSELGKGSCFEVTIPICRERYSDDELQGVVEEPIIEAVSEIAPENNKEEIKVEKEHSDLILIVEDYDDLREYLAHNLSNYKVITCSNGKEALKLANDNMPDLILSDVMMPEMDGLELCKHIKTNIITSHIPVILLTARISAEQKLEGYVHHADAYIEKPFSIDLLTIQIANLLQLRKNISAKYNSDIKESAKEDGMLPLDKKFLDKSTQIIEAGISDPELSVESLSSELGMSRSQLFRKFKALINTTPSQFIKVTRLKKAAELLAGKEYNVNEVAFFVGFVDSSHFISSFKKYYGQTPKQFAESKRTKLDE